jgi:DNA-binding phage protein
LRRKSTVSPLGILATSKRKASPKSLKLPVSNARVFIAFCRPTEPRLSTLVVVTKAIGLKLTVEAA